MKYDKTWMSCARKAPRYIQHVGSFLDFASKYGGGNTIFSCPCRQCKNGKGLHPLSDISLHLLRYGIDLTYTMWRFHGESSAVAESIGDVAENVIGDVAESVGDVDENVGHVADVLGVAAGNVGVAADNVEDVVENVGRVDDVVGVVVDNLGDVQGLDENSELHGRVYTDAGTSLSKKRKSVHQRAREPLYDKCSL